MKIKNYELRIGIPDGFELIGVRTDGEDVVIVCRPQASDVRTIGFVPSVEDDAEEEWEEDKKQIIK